MSFSITIPTYNNLKYLKLCLRSIKQNSKYNHEILLHINDGSDGTLNFAKENNLTGVNTIQGNIIQKSLRFSEY